MLSPLLGEHYVRKWSSRSTANNTWEDRCSASVASASTTSPFGLRRTLGGCWKAGRRVGMARPNEKRSCRPQYSEEAAHKGAQAMRGPLVRPVLAAAHLPHAPC